MGRLWSLLDPHHQQTCLGCHVSVHVLMAEFRCWKGFYHPQVPFSLNVFDKLVNVVCYHGYIIHALVCFVSPEIEILSAFSCDERPWSSCFDYNLAGTFYIWLSSERLLLSCLIFSRLCSCLLGISLYIRDWLFHPGMLWKIDSPILKPSGNILLAFLHMKPKEFSS